VVFNTLGGGTDLKKRENMAFLLVILPAAVILSFMWLLPLHFQRSVFPPSNTLVSGPLYGGALIMGPPFAGFFYLMLATCASQRLGGRRRGRNTAMLPIHGATGWLSLFVFICVGTTYIYGVSAYWFATPDGITIQLGPLSQPTSYRWSEVTKQQVSCFASRGGSKNADFRILLAGRRTVDLAYTQQLKFAEHFNEIVKLTGAALTVETEHNQRSFCPDFILAFLQARHL
jgi:hypothetical protein